LAQDVIFSTSSIESDYWRCTQWQHCTGCIPL